MRLVENQHVRIVQQWKRGFWGFRKTIEVEAEQVSLPEKYSTNIIATAKLTIKVSGKVMHTVAIPWSAPKCVAGLLLQVYMLSQVPSYESPEWQRVMEDFCYRTPGFEKPANLTFTNIELD